MFSPEVALALWREAPLDVLLDYLEEEDSLFFHDGWETQPRTVLHDLGGASMVLPGLRECCLSGFGPREWSPALEKVFPSLLFYYQTWECWRVAYGVRVVVFSRGILSARATRFSA